MTTGLNRNTLTIICSLVATLLLTPITRADSFITLVDNPFNEKLIPEPKISSAGRGMVLGVDVSTSVADSPVSVFASFPTDWEIFSVCLSVLAANGLYVSQNTYKVSGEAKGLSEFPFETSYGKMLERYHPLDIAVAVTLGDCTTDQPEIFFVGAWGSDSSLVKPSLRVVVYSQQASEVFLYDDTEQTETSCAQWNEKTVYDYVCEWQPDFSQPGPRKMEVLTVRNGEIEATDEFSIILGSGFE